MATFKLFNWVWKGAAKSEGGEDEDAPVEGEDPLLQMSLSLSLLELPTVLVLGWRVLIDLAFGVT